MRATGALHLPPSAYQPLVGGLLLVAGVLMARSAGAITALDRPAPETPPFLASLFVSGIIGPVSGVTGVGGGIFSRLSLNPRILRRLLPFLLLAAAGRMIAASF